MIEIEKGVPIPPSQTGKWQKQKYPFDLLEVGESFFVPGVKQANITGSLPLAVKRKPGRKFTCRKVDGGVRIWRIE